MRSFLAEQIKTTIANKRFKKLSFLNETFNTLFDTAIKETSSVFPLAYQKNINSLIKQIPSIIDREGERKYAHRTIYQKIRNPAFVTLESSDTSSTTLFKKTKTTFHIINVMLLNWPKITQENVFLFYYFFETLQPGYQPQLPQLSRWLLPESKEENALSDPIKLAHQSFYAAQLVISTCQHFIFLYTLSDWYAFFSTFAPAIDHSPERDAVIDIVDCAWYSSALLVLINSISLLYYLKTVYTTDMNNNLRPFLKSLNGLPQKIKEYMQSNPWPAGTEKQREIHCAYAIDLLLEVPESKEEETQPREFYFNIASYFYNAANTIVLPKITRISAHLFLVIMMSFIASRLLSMKDYLNDVSTSSDHQSSYGILPWFYHQSGSSTVLGAQWTAPMLRQAELAAWAWFFYPFFIGFFQVILEKIFDHYVSPQEDVFKKQLVDVTESCLKEYFEIKPSAQREASIITPAIIEFLNHKIASIPVISDNAAHKKNLSEHTHEFLRDLSYSITIFVANFGIDAITFRFVQWIMASITALAPQSPQHIVQAEQKDVQVVVTPVQNPPLLSPAEQAQLNYEVARDAARRAVENNSRLRQEFEANQHPAVPASREPSDVKIEVFSPAPQHIDAKQPVLESIDAYLKERKQGYWIEFPRIFMSKKRKMNAGESLKAYANDPKKQVSDETDVPAICDGRLRKLVKTHASFFKDTPLAEAITQYESKCRLFR